MEYIALDLGSSFTKAAVVNVETRQIRNVCRQPTPPRLTGLQSDEFEVCPHQILEIVQTLLDQLVKASPACHGILLTGQMGGLVLCGPDNQPVTNYISWQDRRTTRQHSSGLSWFDRLMAQVGSRVATELGNEFRPGLGLPLLWYLKQTDQLVDQQNLTALTLPDFVAVSLTQSTPVIEWTCLTGLNSITEPGYATSIFAELDLDQFRWPEPVDYRHCVGEYRCRMSSGKSIPVYAATGDHQCSLVGAGLRQGELSINIATGSQISMLTAAPESGDYQLRPFFDNSWLKTITNIPAGRSLSAIMRLLTEVTEDSVSEQHWQRFFAAAESTPTSDIDVNLAFFPGAIAGPGHLSHLTESNLTLGHVARAVLQQMASQYGQLASRFSAAEQTSAPSTPWDKILFSGGLAQTSTLLRSLISEAMNAPGRLCDANQDSLAGMLILGRVIVGIDDCVASAIANTLEKGD